MADGFYSTSYGEKPRRKGRSPFGYLVDTVVGLLSLCVAGLYIALLFVPRLNPYSADQLSTLGLIAPFVYVAMTLLLLYWFIRWRLVMGVMMLVVALFGVPMLSSFYKMELRRSYDEPLTQRELTRKYGRGAIKIVSFNARSFIDDSGARCLDSVVNMIKSLNPDIVCFQEMGFNDLADSLMLPLKSVPKSVSRVDLSPMIYSRYPIIKAQRVDTIKNFLWADLAIGNDTIRVFNNHLHSTHITSEDSQYIERGEYLEDEDMGKIRSMLGRLAENNKLRSVQVDSINRIIDSSPYPVVVCGDFNDTPVSYTYREMCRSRKDTFREVGRGFSHTYRGFMDMLRIDYVVCSDEFTPLSYEVIDSWGEFELINGRDTTIVRRFGNALPSPIRGDSVVDNEVDYSDHYPLFVRLRLDKPEP